MTARRRLTRTAPSLREAVAWRRDRLRRWSLARLSRTETDPDLNGVALTFDDGPTRYTSEVLDILARHEVPATFFVVGRNAIRHPSLIRRMLDEGHALASHSLTHPDPRSFPARALMRDYRQGRDAVEQVAGRDVDLFRPPTGHLDLGGALAARAMSSATWLWTKDAADWEPDLRADDVCDRLAPLRRGDIVLLHDGMERPITPAALDRSTMVAGLDALLRHARLVDTRFVALDGTADDASPPATGQRARPPSGAG